MSKQTFQEAGQKRSQERDWFESLLRLTKAYQKFRQENLEHVSDGYWMLSAFYRAPESKQTTEALQKKMGFYPTCAVRDCPPWPEGGLWATLRINLDESDDHIRQDFELQLRNYRRAENASRIEYQIPKPAKPRPIHHVPKTKDKAERMLLAYRLVENFGPTKAAEQIFHVESNENPWKKDIEKVQRWHDIVEDLIRDL